MINQMASYIHGVAKAKGWWEKPREAGTIHMLIVSEIAEATEEARKNTPPVYVINHEGKPAEVVLELESFIYSSTDKDGVTTRTPIKPEGELIELADAMIRIMDYCAFKGWDLEKALHVKIQYNEGRAHRHGGKAF